MPQDSDQRPQDPVHIVNQFMEAIAEPSYDPRAPLAAFNQLALNSNLSEGDKRALRNLLGNTRRYYSCFNGPYSVQQVPRIGLLCVMSEWQQDPSHSEPVWIPFLMTPKPYAKNIDHVIVLRQQVVKLRGNEIQDAETLQCVKVKVERGSAHLLYCSYPYAKFEARTVFTKASRRQMDTVLFFNLDTGDTLLVQQYDRAVFRLLEKTLADLGYQKTAASRLARDYKYRQLPPSPPTFVFDVCDTQAPKRQAVQVAGLGECAVNSTVSVPPVVAGPHNDRVGEINSGLLERLGYLERSNALLQDTVARLQSQFEQAANNTVSVPPVMAGPHNDRAGEINSENQLLLKQLSLAVAQLKGQADLARAESQLARQGLELVLLCLMNVQRASPAAQDLMASALQLLRTKRVAGLPQQQRDSQAGTASASGVGRGPVRPTPLRLLPVGLVSQQPPPPAAERPDVVFKTSLRKP